MKIVPGGEGGSASDQPEGIEQGALRGRSVQVELPSHVTDYVRKELKGVELDESLSLASRFYPICNEDLMLFRDIVSVVCKFPQEHRAAIVEGIPQAMLNKCQDGDDFRQLLSWINTLQGNVAEQLIRAIPKEAIDVCEDGSDLGELLYKVSEFSPAAVQRALRALSQRENQWCQNGAALGAFVASLLELPVETIEELFRIVPQKVLDKCTDGPDFVEFLIGISEVQMAQIQPIIEGIPQAFFDMSQNGLDLGGLVVGAKEIPVGQMDQVSQAIPKRLIDKCTDASDLGELLCGVAECDLERLTEIFAAIPERYIDKCQTGSMLGDLLLGVAQFAIEDIRVALEAIPEKFYGDGSNWKGLLAGVARLPVGEIHDYLDAIPQTLLDRCDRGKGIGKLIIEFSKLEPGKKQETLEALPQPLLDQCKNGEDVGNLLIAAVDYSPERLSDFCGFFTPYTDFAEASFSDMKIVIDLGECSVEVCKEMLDILKASDEIFISPVNYLAFCLTHPRLQAATREVVAKMLASSDIDCAEVISELVTEGNFLPEEDPLMQTAIEVRAQFETPALKNPYLLYKKLTSLAQVPTEYRPPIEDSMTFNPGTIREFGELFSISSEEIPRAVTLEKWEELIMQLERKKDEFDAEELTGTSWEMLWDGMLNHIYIKNLLKRRENLSITQAQFASIFHVILSQYDRVLENSVLSPQEEMLLKVAAGIVTCDTGKKEGIANTYALLPAQFKLKKNLEAMTSTDEERQALLAKETISNHVQDFLLAQFSGTNAPAQELTGTSTPAEGVHQGLFMKNMIGPLVGLHHRVSFDRHTGVLYDMLVKASREEILEVFYRHVKPQQLVEYVHQQLLLEIDLNTAEGRSLFNSLNTLAAPDNEIWNEEDYSLTEQGVFNIIKSVGFII